MRWWRFITQQVSKVFYWLNAYDLWLLFSCFFHQSNWWENQGILLVFHSEHGQQGYRHQESRSHYPRYSWFYCPLAFINDLQKKLLEGRLIKINDLLVNCVCCWLLWGFSLEPVNCSTTISIFTEKLLLKLIT